jgi:hypothetical protein
MEKIRTVSDLAQMLSFFIDISSYRSALNEQNDILCTPIGSIFFMFFLKVREPITEMHISLSLAFEMSFFILLDRNVPLIYSYHSFS